MLPKFVISRALRPPERGRIQEIREKRCDFCDMSYDTPASPWLGALGPGRDLSLQGEPSTGFIRLKMIMNIFP